MDLSSVALIWCGSVLGLALLTALATRIIWYLNTNARPVWRTLSRVATFSVVIGMVRSLLVAAITFLIARSFSMSNDVALAWCIGGAVIGALFGVPEGVVLGLWRSFTLGKLSTFIYGSCAFGLPACSLALILATYYLYGINPAILFAIALASSLIFASCAAALAPSTQPRWPPDAVDANLQRHSSRVFAFGVLAFFCTFWGMLFFLGIIAYALEGDPTSIIVVFDMVPIFSIASSGMSIVLWLVERLLGRSNGAATENADVSHAI